MSNEYQFSQMSTTARRIQCSLRDERDTWSLKLVQTTANSVEFTGSLVAVLVNDKLPDYEFVLYRDAPYFNMDIGIIFDVLQGDEFFGHYTTAIFSKSQKETLFRTVRKEGSWYNELTTMLKDQGYELYPYRNPQQRIIAEAFE